MVLYNILYKKIFIIGMILCFMLNVSGCAGESTSPAADINPEIQVSAIEHDETDAEDVPEDADSLKESKESSESDESNELNNLNESNELSKTGSKDEPADTGFAFLSIEDAAKPDGFTFLHNGIHFILGEPIENVLSRLGPEIDFYVYASCYFDGDSKMYVYNGFELSTYLIYGYDVDLLYSITFEDDSITTKEGVHIGSGFEQMVAAYGTDYEEIPGMYLYFKEGTVLSFSVEDGIITVITYYVEDIHA